MTDNLFIAYSSLITSKSCHISYHIFILLKTSGLFRRKSDSKFLYSNSILLLLLLIIIIIIIIYESIFIYL